MSSKPPPAFEVYFEGDHIYPEAVPVRSLADALSALQRLASSVPATEEPDDEDDEDEAPVEGHALSLIKIRRGSAVYRVAGPPPFEAQANLETAGRLLATPEQAGSGFDHMLPPLRSLSAVAKRLKCSITLRTPGKQGAPGAVLARIGPSSYDDVADSFFVRGETTILGRVMRVGGATGARCGLRVEFRRKLLICEVESSRVAREIGQKLYEDVEVSGTASWYRDSWRIAAFRIREVKDHPVQGSLLDALRELREAGGSAWDDVADPRAYLEGIESE